MADRYYATPAAARLPLFRIWQELCDTMFATEFPVRRNWRWSTFPRVTKKR